MRTNLAIVKSGWHLLLFITLIIHLPLLHAEPFTASSANQQYLYPDEQLGLPKSYVFNTVEDQFGFLWFATSTGLVRFDGYTSLTYLHDSENPNSLPSDHVRQVFIDKQNQLWVATTKGLAKYNHRSDTFSRIKVANAESAKLDIRTIQYGMNEQLFVASADDLYVVDNTTKELTRFNKSVVFPANIVSILDEPSRLWLGTLGQGVYLYDKRKQQLFSLQEANPWSIIIHESQVRDIKTINGKYWLATNSGLLRLSANDSVTPHSVFLSKANVLNIIPRQDSIYAATSSEIVQLSLSENATDYHIAFRAPLDNNPIISFFIDSKQSHWLGTEKGIKQKTIDSYSLPLIGETKAPRNNKVSGLAEDSFGNIWSVDQQGQISRYNVTRGDLMRLQSPVDAKHWDLVIDDFDRLWLATDKGVSVLSLLGQDLVLNDTVVETPIYKLLQLEKGIWALGQNKQLINIRYTETQFQLHQTSLGIELPQSSLVHVDSFNRLWLSSRDATYVFDTKKSELLSLPRSVRSKGDLVAVVEKQGVIWLIGHTSGMLAVNANDFSNIDSPSFDKQKKVIFSAQGTEDGIWLANRNSLHFFDTNKSKIVQSITPLQLSNNALNQGVSIKTQAGLLGFGGNLGYHLFDPRIVKKQGEADAQTAPPLITEFRLNAKPVRSAADNALLQTPIYLSDELRLQHRDKRISFTLSLINPSKRSEVSYRYKLEGYDREWIPTEDIWSRKANFHNIPWGHYTLLAQAKENGKDWSASTRLPIVIAAPLWFSKQALILYSLVLLVLVLYLIHHMLHKRQYQQSILASQERLQLALSSVGDELWDWDITKGQVYRSNTWGLIDFPRDNLRTNGDYNGNIHPADLERVQSALASHIAGKTEVYEVSYRTETFDKQWLWILDRGKVVAFDHNQQAIRMAGTLKNIQHLKEAEEQLKLFERSFENISEGVFIADTQFKFISVNNTYCRFTGETKQQALASYLYFHQYPEAFTEEIKKSLKQRQNWSGEIESQRVDGRNYYMALNIDAIIDDDGQTSHYVGVFTDISERKATEKELLQLSNTDPLTNLPNRSFFLASHNNLIRRKETHTLLYLDMDNFKKINDSLGHQSGDLLVKQIAARLKRIIKHSATCYRLGGDEFSILIEDNSKVHTIAHFAQEILDNLSRPFIVSAQEYVLSASIGIAFYPEDGKTEQELLKNADTAMYFAKNSGGNSYKFFSGEMNQFAVRQLQIENLIRQGLKDDLFGIFYQPKIDIMSGKLIGMEALVRFEHPQKGIVSPEQFVPIAEQSGQIIEIGEIVLEKALRDTKRWVDMGLFNGRVAVNFSAKQFELEDLDDRISMLLAKVKLAASHLECEITEGTLMQHPEQGLQMMQRLRNKGIHLALDDFGTGYSSLAYLKRFPLNTLKIDKAFIDDISRSSADRHMTAAIINIAHNLGLKVVAEGVELDEQVTILRQYNCEMLQGHIYSKPLRADNFEKLLVETLHTQDLSSIVQLG